MDLIKFQKYRAEPKLNIKYPGPSITMRL